MQKGNFIEKDATLYIDYDFGPVDLIEKSNEVNKDAPRYKRYFLKKD